MLLEMTNQQVCRDSHTAYPECQLHLSIADSLQVVWAYDDTISGDAENSTWLADDTSVSAAVVQYTINMAATFLNLTSDATSGTDIFGDGPFTLSLPSAAVPVTVHQNCPTSQTINGTAIDGNGNVLADVSAVGVESEVLFTIPADAVYPVTTILTAEVGSVTTVVGNVFPVKYAIGSGDNGRFLISMPPSRRISANCGVKPQLCPSIIVSLYSFVDSSRSCVGSCAHAALCRHTTVGSQHQEKTSSTQEAQEGNTRWPSECELLFLNSLCVMRRLRLSHAFYNLYM